MDDIVIIEKAELDKVRDELRGETRKLASDIEDIKENCLRKDDFIRSMTSLENKLDRLNEYIMEGRRNG